MLGAERETAVSPVIGVMLLLAIVIVLAALVASFAGGAVGAKERAPSVDLAVYAAGNGDDFCLVFEHRGGEQLAVRDLKVTTWVHGSRCSASHEGKDLEELLGADTLRAGDSLDTGGLKATDAFLDLEGKVSDRIKESAVVEVTVYHLPSGALLHKSSILLKER